MSQLQAALPIRHRTEQHRPCDDHARPHAIGLSRDTTWAGCVSEVVWMSHCLLLVRTYTFTKSEFISVHLGCPVPISSNRNTYMSE
ncbi:hypothetical protein EYF80_013463 [Liparis tanakae]|uniref:Uncharacterized protein n=1 Tax=Liparis tanakae TaxID=230148 RepID=A0A4Z2IG38_9TELE|nr:hypothetical protein EYF80_013463 [Liparis tanakae]